MPNFLKFLIVIFVVLPFVLLIAKKNHNEITNFETNGIVTKIEWQSRNHGMPKITIREKFKTVIFQSNRITLTPESINIGDTFVKYSNSKICKINEVEIICID